MVGVFAGLKWRLVTSRIRATHGGARVMLIIGWCLAVVVLAGICVGLIALRTLPDTARIAVTTLYTSQFLAWGLAPMVAFGIDETVDPAKFALLPLTRPTLQKGLLATALIGYLPIANAVVLIATSIAVSRQWWMFPIALICAAVQLIACVVFSRALSTAMSGLMSGRRGRDLGVMVGFGLFVIYFGLTYTLNSASGANRFGSGVTSLSGVLSWTPPGALAQLPGFLADGRAVRVVVALLTVMVALFLLWRWWAVSLLQSLTTVPSTTDGSAPAGADSSTAVATTLGGTIRLVAGRDRLLAWRDPMRRVPWLMVAFLAIVWPFVVARGHGSVFVVALPAALVATLVANCYGVDGSGVWLHMVAFADRTRARGEALGHALVGVLPGSVVVLLACLVQVAVHNDWRMLPPALGICLTVLLGAAAISGYLSARLPYAMRQSRKSMFANSIPGQKGRTAATSFGMIGGGLLVAVPAGVCALLWWRVNPLWGWVGLVIGPAIGLTVLWVMSGLAARTYLERAPEILAVVSIGDRS